jgi:hypothetical protein
MGFEEEHGRGACVLSFRLMKISADLVSATYRSYDGLDDRLFGSHEDQEIFVFSRSPRQVLESTHLLIQKVPGLFSGNKSSGARRELTSIRVVVKNEWSYTSGPQPPSMHGKEQLYLDFLFGSITPCGIWCSFRFS